MKRKTLLYLLLIVASICIPITIVTFYYTSSVNGILVVQEEQTGKDIIVSADVVIILGKPEFDWTENDLIAFDEGFGNVYVGAHFYKDHNWALTFRRSLHSGVTYVYVLYVWR